MGIALIVLAVGAVLIALGYFLVDALSEVSQGIGVTSIIVGILSLAFSVIFWLFFAIEVASKNVTTKKLECSRDKLSRLLNEDYNSNNLNEALDFNEKQKICSYKEATFMWSHMGTEGVCVDTIAIPTGKFIPRQILNITRDTLK